MEFLQPSVQHSASNPDIENRSLDASSPSPSARSANRSGTAASISMSAAFSSGPPIGYRAPPPTQQGVVPRAGHPRDDKLRETKQHMIDRFRHFHLGINDIAFYDYTKRRDIVRRIPIPPNQGAWPGHPRPVRRGALWPIMEMDLDLYRDRDRPGLLRRLLLRPLGLGGAGGGDEEDDDDGDPRRDADRWAGIMRRDFRPARFRFRRRLGFGAFGAAFLFEMKSEDGEVLPVVVKVGISGNWRELAREKENFVAMAGARHFVQREVLQTFPLPAEPMPSRVLGRLRRLFSRITGIGRRSLLPTHCGLTARRLEAARRRLDNRRDVIIMEYMSRGTLLSFIAKMYDKNERLSDRMLWLIFECLFKACIAMAYPGRFHTPGDDPWNDFMRPQDETLPYRFPDAPMVHFDIDPSNGDDHGSVPIVKIGDPGLSRIIDEDFRRDEYQLWSNRPTGKSDYLTPEQFTPEWDYEASRGLEELSREETAGNYHWWSNLYQIGWIMSCLVTHHEPPFPPVAWPYTYPAEDGRMVDLEGHSYGKLLFYDRFDGYDFRLRHLIARCLEHNPTKRPTLLYVADFIAANLRREDLREQESDEELLRNARRIFAEAP
ncbi:hypothetical protein VPNG_09917 [Cytospora leucostoma]|uniref:Protein kinase domain-containing protein n=1 Tax=Cytospora leucostoma TaxID=1230097 RepID=A0A423VJA1_9PEZI|nr:hypothetical protein VPNG_09917 [Cytospora leucostoma]